MAEAQQIVLAVGDPVFKGGTLLKGGRGQPLFHGVFQRILGAGIGEPAKATEQQQGKDREQQNQPGGQLERHKHPSGSVPTLTA